MAKSDHSNGVERDRARGPGGRRAGAPVKKTKPTTVRLRPDLKAFVDMRGEEHIDGKSGVLNDAVEYYRNALDDAADKKKTTFYKSIIGAGHGKA